MKKSLEKLLFSTAGSMSFAPAIRETLRQSGNPLLSEGLTSNNGIGLDSLVYAPFFLSIYTLLNRMEKTKRYAKFSLLLPIVWEAVEFFATAQGIRLPFGVSSCFGGTVEDLGAYAVALATYFIIGKTDKFRDSSEYIMSLVQNGV